MPDIVIFVFGLFVSVLCFGGIFYAVTNEMRKAKDSET